MRFLRPTGIFLLTSLVTSLGWQAVAVLWFEEIGEYFEVLPDGKWHVFYIAVMLAVLSCLVAAVVFGCLFLSNALWPAGRAAPAAALGGSGIIFAAAFNASLQLSPPIVTWVSLVLVPAVLFFILSAAMPSRINNPNATEV